MTPRVEAPTVAVVDKLERLREMRDGYEAALDDAARLRDDYHREVVKLHRSGVSLREIAEALGISHQRVHQIVSPRTDEEPTRSKRRATGAAVASVVLVFLLAGGAGLFAWSQRERPPVASPTEPTAVPIADRKDSACGRFLEAFMNMPSVKRIECADVVPASVSGSVVVLDPRTGEVLALKAA